MNYKYLEKQAPIVIGCVGGSGSRVLAEILEQVGCYMGENKNFAYDNMDFAFCLGGRLKWMEKCFPFDKGDLTSEKAVKHFLQLYFSHNLTVYDKYEIAKIGLEYFHLKTLVLLKKRSLKQRLMSIRGLFIKKQNVTSYQEGYYLKWGFKFPGTIFFLNPLIDAFPDMKFIHLVRDGRDMALSSNQNFLFHYCKFIGLENEDRVESSFKMWCEVNKFAEKICRSRLNNNNYLRIRFEDLCSNPKFEIDRIVHFVGLQNVKIKDEIYQIPKLIPSIGRWEKIVFPFDVSNNNELKKYGY